MKKILTKKTNKILILLIIITIISSILYLTFILPKQQYLNTLENELNSLETTLKDTNSALEQNISILEQYQSGNNYKLHDPLYEEAISFIENFTSSSTKEKFENAKNQGLRLIVMGEELLMYELLGFNTADNDMVYFEINNNHYQVIPKLGETYRDCVVGHPYTSASFNDIIVDILHI